MIEIILNNVNCELRGQLDSEVVKSLDKIMSYDHPGYMFMTGARGGYGNGGASGGWDGKVRLLTKNGKFPIGLLSVTESLLKEKKIPYKIRDQRPELHYGKELPLISDKFEIRPYQFGAVKRATEAGSGIMKMATGCHAKGAEILLYDGSVKKAEDVVVGDLLMGPDSKPRRVLELCRGRDRMVKINPTKGDSFTINQDHILSLKRTKRRTGDKKAGNIEDVKFSDWERLTPYGKHIRKLFRVGVDFSKKELLMDPYLMGLLLGDGSLHSSIGITSVDKEIIFYCKNKAEDLGLYLRKNGLTYYFTTGFKNKGKNKLINIVRKEGLHQTGSGNKFIPKNYKTSNRADRLSLLAGILDTDGSYDGKTYDFISKSKKLSEDVAFVSRSLGLAAYISKQYKVCTNNGVGGYYYRVCISGELSEIPCKLPRKKANPRRQKKSVLVTGFKYEEAGIQDYYGFKVDKDHRYLMGDFTVTHNSGKSFIIATLAAKYNIPTVVYVIGIELLYQMKETIEAAYGIPCGIVGGGLCDTSKQVTIMTIWSAAAAFNKKAKVSDNDTTGDSKKHTDKLNKASVRKRVQEAQLFIFDECQYAASETLQFLHRASISAKHRFLLSGTPWRDTGDDILIEAVSGPRICDISATKLIKQGYLVPPDIHFLDVPVMRGVGKTYHDVYKAYVVENEERNDLIFKAAKKLVAAGKKVLILVVRVKHGQLLYKKLKDEFSVSFLDGAKSSKVRMSAIQDMKDGKTEILIASKIFDQGIDIPELDALILAGSGKSSGRALQRIGRAIRKHKGKKKAIIVEFFDNCKYLRDHSEARIKVYRSEPAFVLKIQKNKALKTYPKRAPVKWS
jgi:superfamily II DNA or RNA helicase